MEEVNNLDADARLPPRKRLLAGLKKQNGDSPSPSASPLSSVSSEIGIRLRELMSSNCNGSNLLTEEIVEASRSAALDAVKVAAAARVAAEEKAAVAAKAVAAAKSALELVAAYSGKKSRKQRSLGKNKTKKHVPVEVLYKKRKRVEKSETDEELARRLHRVMNSSPRISKVGTSPDSKVRSHRKRRKRLIFDSTVASNGEVPLEGKAASSCDRNGNAGKKGRGENRTELDEKASKGTKTDCLEKDSLHANVEAEANNHSTEQVLEDSISTARKRGRIKQKKLSLSLCTVRDRECSKDKPKSGGLKSVKEPKGKSNTTDSSLLTLEPSIEGELSQEAVSARQCKEFSSPKCYAGSNILHSLCSNPTVTSGSAMVEVDK